MTILLYTVYGQLLIQHKSAYYDKYADITDYIVIAFQIRPCTSDNNIVNSNKTSKTKYMDCRYLNYAILDEI